MKKIISVFKRDFGGDPSRVLSEVTPGAEWVLAGEGEATRKFDGAATMIRDGKLYKRYDAKHGKTPPPNFEPCQEPDEKTGHWPGWIPVGEGPEDKWFRAAFENSFGSQLVDGTYEAIGPHFQGWADYDYCDYDCLARHGQSFAIGVPRDFEGLKLWLSEKEWEGIVFHHEDGRMAKIKRRDFGLEWPIGRNSK